MRRITIEISEKEDKLLEYISKIGGLSKEQIIRNLTVSTLSGLSMILEAQLEKLSKALGLPVQELKSRILSLEERTEERTAGGIDKLIAEVEEKGELDFLEAVRKYGLDTVKQALEERKISKRGMKLLPSK